MPDVSALHLPRILCLHGGGVNGGVFEIQCRGLVARLRTHFRLVFVDAPLPCVAHEQIVAVYGDQGPFYRWMPWLPEHPEDAEEDAAADLILETVLAAMRRDDESLGGAGVSASPWVGVLGFSQGAKVAASLLWCQERAAAAGLPPLTSFRFGVIMAGSPPVVRLDKRLPRSSDLRHIGVAGQPTAKFDDFPADGNGDHAISTPTLHVLGLRDSGLEGHRRMRKLYCRPGTARLVQWDGDHRLPIKTHDVAAVVDQLLDMAEEAEAI